MRYISMSLIAALALSGCERPAAPPVLSRGEQCLNSFRIELKDPDSAAVVADLGSRDFEDDVLKEAFFLRYKAKNSFGAYISKNVICRKMLDDYQRDETLEFFAETNVANLCLQNQVDKMWNGQATNKVDCDTFGAQFAYDMTDSYKVAKYMEY